jgi:hypothetical protein
MGTTRDGECDAVQILGSLGELQALASAFSRSSTAIEFGIELRVLFVAHAALPWRLVETERFTGGRPRGTRMLYFGLLEEMQQAIEERLAWSAADEEFRAAHMATPGGFPGVTADWVHTKDFDLIFGPTRYDLRRTMCATSSARTLMLR